MASARLFVLRALRPRSLTFSSVPLPCTSTSIASYIGFIAARKPHLGLDLAFIQPSLRLAALSTQSNSKSSSFSITSPTEWWKNRQTKKEEEKFKTRLHEMAQKDAWTIGDMAKEMEEVVNAWTSRLPGVSNSKEVAMAKEMHKTISGLISVVGRDATNDDIEAMSRTDKLRAAAEGNTSVQEINLLIQQFGTTSLMHRVVRKRQLEGKKLPETAESVQAMVQAEGRNMLSKTQKERLKQHSIRTMQRAMRRRR